MTAAFAGPAHNCFRDSLVKRLVMLQPVGQFLEGIIMAKDAKRGRSAPDRGARPDNACGSAIAPSARERHADRRNIFRWMKIGGHSIARGPKVLEPQETLSYGRWNCVNRELSDAPDTCDPRLDCGPRSRGGGQLFRSTTADSFWACLTSMWKGRCLTLPLSIRLAPSFTKAATKTAISRLTARRHQVLRARCSTFSTNLKTIVSTTIRN